MRGRLPRRPPTVSRPPSTAGTAVHRSAAARPGGAVRLPSVATGAPPSRRSDDADVIRARLRRLLDEARPARRLGAGRARRGPAPAGRGRPRWREPTSSAAPDGRPTGCRPASAGTGHRVRAARWIPGRPGARSLWLAGLAGGPAAGRLDLAGPPAGGTGGRRSPAGSRAPPRPRHRSARSPRRRRRSSSRSSGRSCARAW